MPGVYRLAADEINNVIPAKAGIQASRTLSGVLDPGFPPSRE
jgi:hypothetical protein